MIFGFLLAVCFNPDIYAAATTPRWALLAVSLPILIAIKPPSHLTMLHLLGLLFLGWSALSLLWTQNLGDGFGSLVQLVIIAMSFTYGARTSLEETFKGLAIGIALSSIIVISNLRFESLVSLEHEGLFGNRNMLAEAAVLTALGCLAYKQWFFIPGLLPAIFMPPVSRGAIMGLTIGLLATYGKQLYARSKTACVAIAVLVCAAAAISLLDPTRNSFTDRFHLWHDTITGLTFFGQGLGS